MLWLRHCSNFDALPFLNLVGKINALVVSADGLAMATTSEDKALKIYDVVNFG